MELLKKGSKGENVRKVQKALNIDADGIFGPNTEKAVIAYQKSVGLKPVDGIVGPQTWAKLFGDEKPQEEINITKGYINTHISHSPGRPLKYIVIHYTAGSTSKAGSALVTRNVFLKRKASADFVVDDATIVQINPDIRNYFTWNCGDAKNPYSGGGKLYGKATNKNTIGIEVCSNLKPGASSKYANHVGWYYTDASLNNTLKLVRYLMSKYNIPLSNVVRHYDVSGKLCPGIIGWNDAPIYDFVGNKTGGKNNSKAWDVFKCKI